MGGGGGRWTPMNAPQTVLRVTRYMLRRNVTRSGKRDCVLVSAFTVADWQLRCAFGCPAACGVLRARCYVRDATCAMVLARCCVRVAACAVLRALYVAYALCCVRSVLLALSVAGALCCVRSVLRALGAACALCCVRSVLRAFRAACGLVLRALFCCVRSFAACALVLRALFAGCSL